MHQKKLDKWFDTFLREKGIDLDTPIVVDGPSGPNYMTVGTVMEHIRIAGPYERVRIHHEMVRLDVFNKPVLPYLKHLAKAIAR